MHTSMIVCTKCTRYTHGAGREESTRVPRAGLVRVTGRAHTRLARRGAKTPKSDGRARRGSGHRGRPLAEGARRDSSGRNGG
eukprot:3254912-Prymnesium_polylepis.1